MKDLAMNAMQHTHFFHSTLYEWRMRKRNAKLLAAGIAVALRRICGMDKAEVRQDMEDAV